MKKLWFVLLFAVGLVGCVPVQESPEPDAIADGLHLIDQGTAYLQMSDLARAKAAFEVAWDLAALPAALDGLGCVAFLEGDLARAQKYFVSAYEQDETYTTALGNLALLYESVGMTNEAQILYKRVLKEDPRNFRARNNFAGFLIEHKNEGTVTRERAKRELLRAEALTDHSFIQKNLEKVE